MRSKTREVLVGGVGIGGNNPVRVQSMCNTKTEDIRATVSQIIELQDAGCELVRVAVPSMEAAKALGTIRKRIGIPLIADIHYDYRLALASIPNVDKLRINPGTMPRKRLKEVVQAAKRAEIPIRVGINAASMEKGLQGSTVKKMITSVETNIRLLEGLGFSDIVVALKSSDLKETIKAYKGFSAKHDYPLHVGLTEAGEGIEGITRSAVAVGILLNEGIGDTIRISLTGNPLQEVLVAYEILNSLGIREKPSPTVISCPTCSRCTVELEPIVKQVKQRLPNSPIKVAVMGCEVNGPGEAKEADFGLAFSRTLGFLFIKGKVLRGVPKERAIDELVKLVKNQFNYS